MRSKLREAALLTLVFLAALMLVPIVMLAFIVVIVWHEPRIPVGIALGLLMATAISLAAGGQGVAEGLATFAYFFLASGVVFMVVKHVKEGRGTVEEQTDGDA